MLRTRSPRERWLCTIAVGQPKWIPKVICATTQHRETHISGAGTVRTSSRAHELPREDGAVHAACEKRIAWPLAHCTNDVGVAITRSNYATAFEGR